MRVRKLHKSWRYGCSLLAGFGAALILNACDTAEVETASSKIERSTSKTNNSVAEIKVGSHDESLIKTSSFAAILDLENATPTREGLVGTTYRPDLFVPAEYIKIKRGGLYSDGKHCKGLEADISNGLDELIAIYIADNVWPCLLYTSPSPRDATLSRMPSSA